MAADGRRQYSFFVRVEYTGRVKAPPDRNSSEDSVSGGPSHQPWFSLSHCQSPKTSPIRGDCVSVGAPATTVSAVLPGHHHRSWPTAETGPRRTPRPDLDPPRRVPALWTDLHHPAALVAALRPLQLSLPGTSLGSDCEPRQRLGAGGSADQRPPSLARSGHLAALGMAPAAQPVRQSDDLVFYWPHWPSFLRAPTILAWDWPAAGRTLQWEANSP